METTNYGHLSRQLKEIHERTKIARSGADIIGDFGTIEFLIPEINRLERIVSALESIGVNLDETDIVALEGIARDADYRRCVRDNVNRAMADWQIDSRELEQSEAIHALTSAGFVLNDDDGETWERVTVDLSERVTIELTNGRESRYRWQYETNKAPRHPENGVSGEFHRLLKLIAPVASDPACGGSPSGEPCKTTEVSHGK